MGRIGGGAALVIGIGVAASPAIAGNIVDTQRAINEHAIICLEAVPGTLPEGCANVLANNLDDTKQVNISQSGGEKRGSFGLKGLKDAIEQKKSSQEKLDATRNFFYDNGGVILPGGIAIAALGVVMIISPLKREV